MRGFIAITILPHSLLAFLATVSAFAFSWPFLDSAKPEKLSLCVPELITSALPIYASISGIFTQEGLEVDLSHKPFGWECLAESLHGRVDLAVSFASPAVHAIADGKDLIVVSELHQSTKNTKILYDTTRIKSPSDLAGKKIALVAGTNAEFFLDLYLGSLGKRTSDVTRLPLDVKKLDSTFPGKAADAVLLWEPQATELIAKHGGRVAAAESKFYTEISVISGLRPVVAQKKSAIEKLVTALLRAEALYRDSPEKVQTATERYLGYKDVPNDIWKKINLKLRLSAVLVGMMEFEINALKGRKIEDETFQMRERIDDSFLLEQDPDWVTYK